MLNSEPSLSHRSTRSGTPPPARIIAIGNDAAVSANRVAATLPLFCVRHPSYGGQTQFLRQITDLYDAFPHIQGLLYLR